MTPKDQGTLYSPQTKMGPGRMETYAGFSDLHLVPMKPLPFLVSKIHGFT